MRVELRPRVALGLLVVVFLAITAGSVVAAELTDPEEPPSPETVELADGTELWPYTSRAPAFKERTLAINLVVYGDTEATERALRQSRVGDWEEIEEGEEDISPAGEGEIDLNQTTIAWGTADGAIRYIYVEPQEGEAKWMAESYQLRDGNYLGARHHIRAYENLGDADWTAMQAHYEHWDWFHLRHTVTSIEKSQLYVEEQFVDTWYVEDLHRVRMGNDLGSDSDGWVTIVEIDEELVSIMLGLLFFGSVGARRYGRDGWEAVSEWRQEEGVQISLRAMSVVLSIVAVYMLIRFGAIAAEQVIPWGSPKYLAVVFYPALVIGMPMVAYLTARPLDGFQAFTAAAIGFAVATFMDYTYLGVTTLPMDTFVHRTALGVAIGLVAAGASQTARSADVELGHVRTGTLLWAVAVCLPLLQFL